MKLILVSTSCAPRRSSVSPQSAGTNLSSSDDWSDVVDNSGGKNSCGGTTRQHSDSASVNHDSNVHGDASCQRHHHDASSSSSSNVNYDYGQAKITDRESQTRHSSVDRSSAMKFIDKLQALPLQCDITIVPRVPPPPHSTATSDLFSIDATNEDDSSNNSIGGDQDIIQPIRITKQNFHPCGLDNIVRLDGTTVPEEFILTLANCSIRLDESNSVQTGEEMMSLPVQAVPSSFSVPSSNTIDIHHDTTPYSYSLGGEKHNVEEVAVSFDFSMAMDMYQQQLETSEAVSAAEELNHNDRYSNPHVNTQSWNADDTPTAQDPTTTTTTNNNFKNMKINSIMSTLEEESQFIKKTLFVLGSFGCVLLICMVWTIWKLERGRRSVRRSGSSSSRVQVKKVFVDNVPCEFIGTTTNAAASTSVTNKSRSLRSNVGRAHFLEEISPIRSLTSLDENKEAEMEVDGLAAASGNKEVMHETLHLITPQDVTCNSSSRSKTSKNDDGGKKSSSPRHWYEDFLSPKGCSKKATRNRSDDVVIISEHEEVARSLFCSSSTSDSSNKVSPSMDNKDSTTSTTSILNAPKKKVLVSPIERSSFSPPPPSDVSLLKLSNDIEMSSKSPLMISTETEETHDSSTRGDLDEPSPSIEVVGKDKSGIISPSASIPITEESNGPTVCTPINTPKPKQSRAQKTPATDISLSSQESHASSSRKARKIFAQELAKKAWMTPPDSEKSDFSTSIARRAAEVQTPKKTLTPLSADSSLCDDEPSPFLADYW